MSLKKKIVSLFRHFGFNLTRIPKYQQSINREKKINLNVGSGGVNIPGFINLDLESKWYEKSHKKSPFIKYNIITDNIPYGDEEVDNIYISHVIEHLEDDHILKLFKECLRVLKKNGVLRIITPDARFIYEVSVFKNDFWIWLQEWFVNRGVAEQKVTSMDYYIREISTGKIRHLETDVKKRMELENIHTQIQQQSFEETISLLSKGDHFDIDKVGNHINWWTFEKVKLFLERASSDQKVSSYKIIHSKYQGSISSIMTGPDIDNKHPQYSLYVEFTKI